MAFLSGRLGGDFRHHRSDEPLLVKDFRRLFGILCEVPDQRPFSVAAEREEAENGSR